MSNLMVFVQKHLDAIVDSTEDMLQIDIFDDDIAEQFGIGHHLHKGKPTAQSSIQSFHRAIGCIHGTDEIQIGWYKKFLLAIRKDNFKCFVPSGTFGFLNQRNQLTKYGGYVAPIDFVDN
ncbi:hypothetical protein D3C81_1054910 [compost metagenome]